ncbi:short chain dehydrogenase [Xylariaceae sp. FL1272]|nr:short chain dehydrogenase [Xylariaceae sp. FL1272]
MEPPFPCPTQKWHNDLYPPVEYTNPQLSREGETVVVTGAGSGVGRETAVAFATAGAKHILLLGRNETTLKETESQILQANNNTEITIQVGDVSCEDVIQQVAGSLDSWNVMVHCAAYMNTPAPISTADVDTYFKCYETNVKSLLLLAKHLIPKAHPTDASFIALIAGPVALPPSMLIGLSGYLVSKLAMSKIIEFLSVENTQVDFFAVHPGFVDTYLFRRSGSQPETMPMDTVQLAAGFNLWISSSDARFLNGKTVWANWDIDELIAMKDEILQGSKLSYTLNF